MSDGNTHVTQKSETLKRWQETDPELRDFVLQELHVEAKVQVQLNVKRKNALSVAYCLLIEMAGA